jgi:hypothetical protein
MAENSDNFGKIPKISLALYIIEWVIKLHLAAQEINHIDEVV